jgi:hypothetical protein
MRCDPIARPGRTIEPYLSISGPGNAHTYCPGRTSARTASGSWRADLEDRLLLTVLVAVTLCVGCAGRTANPVTTQQHGDDKKTCQELEREAAFIQGELQRLIFVMDLSRSERTEVDAYRQRNSQLLAIARDKQCGFGKAAVPEFTKSRTEEADTTSK